MNLKPILNENNSRYCLKKNRGVEVKKTDFQGIQLLE
jgi:hypothetical protein